MRLYVYVLEAKDLPAKRSYVKLQVGKFKSKTRAMTNGSFWNEEFVFRVHDVEDELVVSIYNFDDDSKLFNVSGYWVDRVRIPVWTIAGEDNQCLPPTWFSLQKPKPWKHSKRDCGKVILALSLHGREESGITSGHENIRFCDSKQQGSPDHVYINTSSPTASSEKIPQGKKLMKAVANRLEKLLHRNGEPSRSDKSSDLSVSPSEYEECMEQESPSSHSFEEAMDLIQSREGEQGMPDNLQGGILLDQIYVVPSKDLNALLFASDSQLRRDLAEMQGITDCKRVRGFGNRGIHHHV